MQVNAIQTRPVHGAATVARSARVVEIDLMRMFLAVFLALSAGLSVAFAAPLGDAANGKRLAEEWCASCHLVSPEQTSATTEAPPFEEIAERPPEAIETLDTFLQNPHPPMPQLSLTRAEIRDLVAYIESLKD